MTPEQLANIQARADAATEGPWRLWHDRGNPEDYRGAAVESAWSHDEDGADTELITDWCRPPDAEFIAHARTDVPALLALVQEQQAKIERGLALARNLDRLAPGDQHYAGLIRAALTATEGAE